MGPAPPERVLKITLRGKLLDLHVSRPATPAAPVVVLYASGDGGWFGAAVNMFQTIGQDGYPVAGFSTRHLMAIENTGERATLGGVARDYQEILARARDGLGLPASAPAILTGWSSGAAFAVLVPTTRIGRDRIAGVVAIGLADTQSLRMSDEGDDDPAQPPAAAVPDEAQGPESRSFRRRREVFETYPRLARLAPIPCAVIQSTGDGYLPAARALALFGDPSPLKRFFTVSAHNHRFGGGAPAFRESLREALAWVTAGSTGSGF